MAVEGSVYTRTTGLMEHYNGDGAGPGLGHVCGRGDRARRGSRLAKARVWRLGGGEPFGTVTKNEASPLPLNKALRKLKSLWSNFAIKEKFVRRL